MNVEGITEGPMTSPSDLIDLEEKLMTATPELPLVQWAFRGQPRTFGTLVPSFQRIFRGKKSARTAGIMERDLIAAFRTHYTELQDRTPLMPGPQQIAEGFEMQCLSVMQHYGVPTRLLDWTVDFWTAVYFACAGDPGEDSELWMYDRSLFIQAMPSDPEKAPPIWMLPILPPPPAPGMPDFRDPRYPLNMQLIGELIPQFSPRMMKQAAHHTVSTDVFSDHATLILELAKTVNIWGCFRRVVIANACKEKALRFLEQYKNVTAGTVFPDVEGLGRFLRWHLDSLVTTLL